MSVPLKLSESLAAAMWATALMIIFFNVLLIVVGWPRRKENGVNGFLLYCLLLCNLLTAMFVLLHASLNNSIRDDGAEDKYRSLCSLAGYLGAASGMLSLSAMLTAAANLLLHLLFPRCFQQGKDYLPRVRCITLAEALLVLLAVLPPFLPLDGFRAGQARSRSTLCLPLHGPAAPMWEVTLLLYVAESLAVFLLALLFAVMFCHLGRQRNVLVSAIPMEARVLRKNSLLVKRLGCMLLGTALFWIPPLLTLLCSFAGLPVSDSVLQWMFGVVQPFGSMAGPLSYMLRVTCKHYTLSSCIKGTRDKVAKARDTVQMQIGQLTGAVTVPQKIEAYRVPNGNHVRTVESISGTHQKSTKRSNAPSVVHWVETVPIIGRHMNMNFGIVEWQSRNGSPRRGLLKVFIKPHSREWRNESSILYRLSRLEHHRNIVEYLWHSKSSQTKLERDQTEPPAPDPEKPPVQKFICTAYYQHGTLRDFLHNHPRTIQESHVHTIATQVSAGMAYLHAMNIAHGLMETTSVLIGGHVETMAIKVVIANFSKAVDLTRKPSSSRAGGSKKDEPDGGAPTPTLPNVPANGQDTQSAHQTPVPERGLFVGDVRSFALLLLEMIAWLKMIRIPEDREPVGHQFRSWTLDRKPKCGLSRGWTLAPGADARGSWSDDACRVAANRKICGSLDSCGSDFNSSTDDMLSDGGGVGGGGCAMHCWENAVASYALRGDGPSSAKNDPSLTPDNPSWEEIGTFPRRTKRQKPFAVAEFSGDGTLEIQAGARKRAELQSSAESPAPSPGAKAEARNGPLPQGQARKGLGHITEDGSCCIVNPYFDMVASDEEATPVKDTASRSADGPQPASTPVHTVPGRTVTGAENSPAEKPSNGPDPKAADQSGKRRRNHLVAKDGVHCAKRDSLCSVDSGISSHQSSMRSGSSGDKRTEGLPAGAIKTAVPHGSLMARRQRMIHQSGVHATFDSFPESGDGLVERSSNGGGGDSAGQHVETWVENHTVPNGQHRPGTAVAVDRPHRIKPRVPETLQEVDSPECPPASGHGPPALTQRPNGESAAEASGQAKSESSGRDTVTSGEESGSERGNHKSRVSVTRSASSLSQFYVRKRAPRPHNITIVPGAASTLPVGLQRRSIHAPDSPRLLDMGRGRPSSCHGQVAANKSSSLDSASLHSGDSLDHPCCAYHGQHSPVHQAHTDSVLPRQTRSLEDSCSGPGSAGPPCPADPSQSLLSLRKLHRQDAILESINELSARSLANQSRTPRGSFEDKLPAPGSSGKKAGRRRTGTNAKRVPSTGISQQHVNFCQELQALLPCLPKVVLGFWWKQQGCGQAVLQWIDSLKDYDGCLYSQLISILESCWSKEPPLPSAEVHMMLDNCLTEVAL